MHPSRYALSEYDDRRGEYLLFSSFNGAFAALSTEAFMDFKAGSGPCAQKLSRLGLLTDLTPDQELDALKSRLADAREHDDRFRLSLIPTYACNFNCPYCYEEHRTHIKGSMDERLMDAIESFLEARYEQYGFRELEIQWYGGDPSLALHQVAEFSRRTIAWCNRRSVRYEALMLTNANVIGEKEARLIADSKIGTVLLTIDGPEDVHNRRRIAANGTNSYKNTIQAARLLRAQEITLQATMNVDRNTWPLFAKMRDDLLSQEGIYVTPARLCDYAGTYGTAPFAKPEFDLLGHDEFCKLRLEEFARTPHTAGELRELLRPPDRFCSGQSGAYYVIDCRGDVYHCDGRVGDASYIRFNIFDGPESWKPSEITFDATMDPTCSQCDQLPLCLGSCIWERSCTGMPCYPLKDTIGDYLRIYRDCFEASPHQTGIALLAGPIRE